jgi:hypothetical protein
MAMGRTDNEAGPRARDPVQRFALRLKACLKNDRPTDAVRLFMDGVAHELVPDRPDLARWLMEVVGRVETLRLARAFALQGCFYCKNGLERCDACDGRGYYRDRTICERCLGVGVAACDFCAGSGWVTYNYVPVGLRLLVILERARAAAGEAGTLLRKPVPAVSERSPREMGKALAKELMQLNRLLGVFENAVTTAEKLLALEATIAPAVRKLVKTCLHTARKLKARTRGVLRGLAQFARLQSTRAAGPAARTVAARRAKFYESLVASEDFLGSGLHHPRLQERREPPRPSPTPPPRAEPP